MDERLELKVLKGQGEGGEGAASLSVAYSAPEPPKPKSVQPYKPTSELDEYGYGYGYEHGWYDSEPHPAETFDLVDGGLEACKDEQTSRLRVHRPLTVFKSSDKANAPITQIPRSGVDIPLTPFSAAYQLMEIPVPGIMPDSTGTKATPPSGKVSNNRKKQDQASHWTGVNLHPGRAIGKNAGNDLSLRTTWVILLTAALVFAVVGVVAQDVRFLTVTMIVALIASFMPLFFETSSVQPPDRPSGRRRSSRHNANRR